MSYDLDAIRAANDLATVAGSYTRLVRAGSELRGPCPCHGGDGNNFYIYAKNGRQQFACFSHGCHESEAGSDVIGFIRLVERIDFKAACEFLGGKHDWKPNISNPPRPVIPPRVTSKPPTDAGMPNMAWLFRRREPNAPREDPEAVREFRDLDGSLLGFECRYPRGCDPDDPEKSPSRMWTWGAVGDEAPRWGCGAFSRPRPLYGLDRLGARPSAPVCITEGPKKADAAAVLLPAYACVSLSGGAHGWKYHDLEPLRGKKILLWPDNDAPGVEAMQALAGVLGDPQGLACV